MSNLRKVMVSAIIGLIAVGSFWMGGNIASNRMSKGIDGLQSRLAFRHLKAYERIHSSVVSDCKSRAISDLEFLIDQQKMLMAEYVQSTDDETFAEYVSTRNPALLDDLYQYPIDWDKELVLPECEEVVRE